MSKKYTLLLVGLMALCSEFAWSAEKSVLMLTADEEEARCELIYSLNGAENFKRVLYSDECNASQLAVLDRDIAMIQKYSSQLLVNKKLAEGYWRFYIIPGGFKLNQIIFSFAFLIDFVSIHFCEALIDAIMIKLSLSAYRHYVTINKVFIKEMQRRWDQGQVIIAQLNGIKQKVVDQVC